MRRKLQSKNLNYSNGPLLAPVRAFGFKVSVPVRLIGMVVATIFLIVILQLGLNFYYATQRAQIESRTNLETVYSIFQNNTADLEDTAASLATSIADREDVQELFLHRDRQGLVDLLGPLFNNLKKEYRVAHLYVHDRDGVVFVRIHKPTQFGDNVLYRPTIQTALDEKIATKGIELGANRMGVRGVAPMYDRQGNLIGLVEIGLDFDDQHLADLKTLTQADFRIWIKDSLTAPANYASPEGSPEAPLPELVYYNKSGDTVLSWTSADYTKVMEDRMPIFLEGTDPKNQAVGGMLVPLLGYRDRVMGVIEIYQSTEAVYQGFRDEQRIYVIVGIGLGLIATILSWLLSSFAILRPLNHLTEVARRQLGGEQRIRANVSTGDEYEQLGKTLNTLADNVDLARQNLERQIAHRTRELILASEVGRSLSSVRDLDTLLSTGVNLIQTRFSLYYVQIYLADPTGRVLTLRAGSGTVGAELIRQGHHLPVGTGSVNGRAAAERQTVLVSDTRNSSTFRPNPLLPETLSEVAVPLIYSDRVVGVLDLQSKTAQGLNTEILPSVEALAGQLAVAIENALLYTQSLRTQQEIEVQTRKLTREGWQEFLDAIVRSERIGYAYEEGNLVPVQERKLLQQGQGKLGVPIMVGGEAVGGIQMVRPPEVPWTESEEMMVHTVAEQIAHQMENLRIIAQAEGYRTEAEAASRRLLREGWKEYSQGLKNTAFFYDLNQVQVASSEMIEEDRPKFVQTLRAHEEAIGELGIIGAEKLGVDDQELVDTVADRLAAHIENLRLSEQTQMALAETAALYQGSERVINASNMDALLEAVVATTGLNKVDRVHFYFFDTPWENQAPQWMTNVATWARSGVSPEPVGTSYRIQDFPFLENMTKGQPLLVQEVSNDSRVDANLLHVLEEQGIYSLSIFPVLVGGQWIGEVFAQSLTGIDLSEDEIRHIDAMIDQAGTVAQNLRLIEQTQKALSETEALYAIISKLNAAQDYNAILDAVADYTILSRANQSLVMCTYDRMFGRGQIPEWAIPIAYRSRHEIQIAAKYPISAFEVNPNTVFTNQPVILEDIETDPRLDRITRTLFQDVFRARSGIIVPLMLGDQSIGFILGSYGKRTQFEAAEIQRLSTVANQVAVALQGLQLLRQTVARARREQIMLEITEQINRAVDTDSIMRTAVEELGKALQKQTFVVLGGKTLTGKD